MTSATLETGRREMAMGPLDEAMKPTWKAVYTITDRGNGRKYWLRIGTAFLNRDQSWNVRLDAVPVNGQLHIREATPRDLPPGRSEPDDMGVEWGNT